MDIDKYTNTLSLNVSLCQGVLKILKDFHEGKIDLADNSSAKAKVLQIITDYAVLKIHCLFDTTKGVISFEKVTRDFKKYLTEEEMKSFVRQYESIKNEYAGLIKRIENNRKIAIAHSQKEEELGLDQKSLDKIKEIWGERTSGVKAVEDEYVYIVNSNFPIEEAFMMVNKLEKLIFYYIWYPKIKKND